MSNFLHSPQNNCIEPHITAKFLLLYVITYTTCFFPNSFTPLHTLPKSKLTQILKKILLNKIGTQLKSRFRNKLLIKKFTEYISCSTKRVERINGVNVRRNKYTHHCF